MIPRMSKKGQQKLACATRSSRLKHNRENAIHDLKRQLRDRDKEPSEEVLNKYNEVDGTTLIQKEEFHYGIFYLRGCKPVFDYDHNRSCLYKTKEEAESKLNELKNKGFIRIEIREILEW